MKNTVKKIVGFTVALLALVGVASSASAAACTSYTFGSGVYTIGSPASSYIKEVQQFLNANGAPVSVSGAGSMGYETMNFASKTKAAVRVFQVAHGVANTGNFGPITRAAALAVQTANCGNTQTPPPQSGSVVASLASNTPASGTLVATQATADLAHFTFSGTGVVTNVSLQRVGVSADSTLSNVYLFDGATRLTDAASVTNGGMISFNNGAGIFSVSGSKTISVKADIASGTSGQTVGVKLVSFMTAGSLASSVGVSGNLHSIATATLAGVSAGTVSPSGSTINPGASQTLWQSTLSITQRDVWLKRLALRQVGSAPANSMVNFKLYANGVMVGSVVPSLDAMGYVTFDLSANPVLLASGSRLIRVEADVVSGASRTIQLSLRQASDVDFVDSSYGVNITPTSTPWVASTALTIGGTSGGTMIISKDTSFASGNITAGASDVEIGRFTAQAFGEAIKIESLKVAMGSSLATVNSLRNGRVLVNGVQYGSTASLVTCDTDNDADCDTSDTSGTGTSYTLNYVVMPGAPVTISVHADAYDDDGTNNLVNGTTVFAAIAVGSSNAVRQDSLGYVSVPAAIVTGQTMTNVTASASLLKNTSYANQTVNIPQTAYKIGSWNLSAGSSEALTVNTFTVDFSTSGTFTAADLTNVYLRYGNGQMTTPLGTVSASGNTFSVAYTLPQGTSTTIDLYANVLSGAITAADSITASLTVTGTSSVSGTTVTTSTVTGQTITYNTGSFTISLDGSSPLNQIVAGNQEVVAGAFKFQASNDTYTVTQVDVSVPAAAVSAVSAIKLYDGSTLVGSQSFTGNDADTGTGNMSSFTNLNWAVPAGTTKILTVKFFLNTIGQGLGTSQQNAVVQLDQVKYMDSTGTITSYTTDVTANELYVYKTVPTVSKVQLVSTPLVNSSEAKFYEFTVSANTAGPVSIKQFKLSSTVTDVNADNTLEMDSFKLYENGVDVTSSVTITDQAGNSIEGTSGLQESGTDSGIVVTWDSALESTIAAGMTKTYAIYATPDGFTDATDDDSFTLNLLGDAAHNSTAVYLNAGDADGIVDLHTSAAAATASANDYNFIWSDNSSSTHSAAVGTSSSGDWANGYKVLNLPLTAQYWNN